jgi:hypothetical protein
MSCERYASAIVDHACGAEIAADAVAHLESCAGCRRLFDEQRGLVQQLDEELQRALAIEPSPRFVPEVLARVERSATRWPRVAWWTIPAVAAAAVLVLIAIGVLRSNRERIGDSQIVAAPAVVTKTPEVAPTHPKPAPTVKPDEVAVVADSHRSTGAHPVLARSVEHQPRPTQGQAAAVRSAVQPQAIARYLTLVRRGVLDTSALAVENETGAAAPADLTIAPLSVDALEIADVGTRTDPAVDRRGPDSR